MSLQKDKKNVDRTILAITDFTRSSTNTVLFAANLFKKSNLKFLFLHSYESPKDFLIFVEDILAKKSEAGLKKQSSEIATILKQTNLDISTHSITDELKKAVSTIAQSEDIDLIVAGIPADKYPCRTLNNIPMLFMGKAKHPILLVPEGSSEKPVKRVLTINLDTRLLKNTFGKKFEDMVNHDHVAKHIIFINENIQHTALSASIHKMLSHGETDLIILIPASGDRIDRALQGYKVQELYPAVVKLLAI